MFIGREIELNNISKLLNKTNVSILIYGKRKVGKTTLIMNSLKNREDETIYFECIKSSLKDNIDNFVNILIERNILQFKIEFSSFIEVFKYLNTLNTTFNIVIDEYPYLKSYTDSKIVDSIFQNIIDNHLKNIRLFISGSHIGMMKDLLEEKNALYGRFTNVINLKELNYLECSNFYKNVSSYDKLAFYSVFGGSPFINKFIDESMSLKENIINTILNPISAVYNYVDNLLMTDYSSSVKAERIFYAISNGKKKYNEIENKLGQEKNGLLSKQLKVLLDMEIVSKTFPINRPNDNKKVYYEINDNLLRFYYTYIFNNKSALQVLGAESFYNTYIEPTITNFISHRFEEIVRVYFSLLVKSGKLSGIYNIGTYYYDDSVTKSNGEFDIAIEKTNSYDIYEVKYYTSKMKLKEINEEVNQIKNIKGITIDKIGFVCTAGFESKPEEYTFIDAEMLYNL